MQQLTIEHKKIPKTTDQKVVENKIATKKEKDRREGKGQLLAISRNVFRILNSDTYYVESETNDNIYYFVRYEPSFTWCSC